MTFSKLFYIILSWGILFSLFAQEQKIIEERYRKYKLRDIQNVIDELQDRPRELIANLKEKLNKFYLADPSKKKIKARKKVNYGIYNSNANEVEFFNANSRRLRIREIIRKPIKGLLLNEAPPLHLMHKAIAKNLLKDVVPKLYESEFHFRQALRYRTLNLTPEIFTSKNRLELLDQDDPQIQLANDYQNTKNNLEETIAAIKKLKENNIILSSDYVTGTSDDSVNFSSEKSKNRAQIRLNKQLIVEKNQKFVSLEKRFTELRARFQKEAIQWNRESANFLIDSAEVQKKIENQLKNRQKILNKSSLYKASFNQAVDYDYTQNSDFRAYATLLELAADLDKSNPITPLKLAREYKTTHENKKAIFYFEQSLLFNKQALKDLKLTSKEFKEIMVSLADINYQEKRFVDAAKYYETALKLEDDTSLLYFLGSLHYEKTGYYKRSIELLTEYLNKLGAEEENFLEVVEKSREMKKRFFALYYVALSSKKLREYESMLGHFQALQKLHLKFRENIKKQGENMNQILDDLNEIKKKILDKSDRENLNQFYLLENRYRESKTNLSQLKTIQNALPLKNLYFALAEYWEEKKNFQEAISTYQKVQIFGIGSNEARRREIQLKNRK